MLNKLVIENFKSFKNIKMYLKDFNVLVGPNASGKSNFLDAIEFISSETKLPNLIKEMGGYKAVSFGGENKHIKFTCEFVLKKDSFVYEFEISNENGHVQLEYEALQLNKKRLFEVRREKDDTFYSYINNKIINLNTRVLTIKQLPQLVHAGKATHQMKIAWEYISSWRVYNFIPKLMKSTMPVERTLNLSKNGENLAQVLHTFLTEERNIFLEIEETLKEAIPEIEELLTPLNEKKEVSIAVKERGFRDKFSFYQISDGTFRLLAYITALKTNAQLLAFEEPENSIHPWLLELLVNVLKSSKKQIIITTHSPKLLDHVDVRDIIIVEKENNESVCKRISTKNDLQKVKRLLNEGIMLGEQWLSNVFGGVP